MFTTSTVDPPEVILNRIDGNLISGILRNPHKKKHTFAEVYTAKVPITADGILS